MKFLDCYNENEIILMEGAIGERLKREYSIFPDNEVALASHVYHKDSKQALREIFSQYIQIAETYHYPIMVTTPTRRANKDAVARSEYSLNIIEDNVRFMKELSTSPTARIYIGGLMGCRGDAYQATDVLSIEEAVEFHSWQADLFRKENVDYLYAGIMPAISEAIGMAKAMEATELPYIISFMIREDGRLIDGTSIHEAIMQIDEATGRQPLCYMTNCVHPIVLGKALSQPFNKSEVVRTRFKGIQANTSPLTPEDLDNCCELMGSDYICLAEAMADLRKQYQLKIFGGCCGTDQTHMEEIAKRLKNC